MNRLYKIAIVPAALLAACSIKTTTTPAPAPAASVKSPSATTASPGFFDKTGMDTTVSPGEDFFKFANGGWYKNAEIPASETAWGSFYTLYNENIKNLNDILTGISQKQHNPGSTEQKVGDFFLSGMDTVAIDARGYDPVKPVLTAINNLSSYKALLQFAAERQKKGDQYIFAVNVGPDDRISNKNAVSLSQTGLGLPNRDYYFKTDAATQNIRKEYVKYIAKLFSLTGTDSVSAAKSAQEILKLETAIAKSHLTPVELRDPVKNYNKYSVSQFSKQVPELGIRSVLNQLGLQTDTIIVGQPSYYKALSTLLKTQPLTVWKQKLRFQTLNSAASALSKDFRDARFNFFGRVLSGQRQQQPRWKQMVNRTDAGLGELLGELYVQKYFPGDAKGRMMSLVNNLQSVYKSRIERLDWMSAETKQQAIAKLNAIIKKIGYPDTWKKYDDVTINRSTYYENLKSIAEHDYKEMASKLGSPVDKGEWFMTPPTVNAYYNPAFNEIVFPAGILQPPFFDHRADDAINYGAIGAVIGHEITHGFDDQGRQYDKDGNLKDWWTKEDADKFNKKADAVAKQYGSYKILDSLAVNGQLTMGENIADIGGLAIAYEAFKRTPQGKSNELIDGLTPDQRFFLSFAQGWRVKTRDERMRLRIATDPHSPEEFRVNGPLSNMDAFYKAFNIQPGEKMYRPESERVKIW